MIKIVCSRAFSLVEMLITLVVVSILLSAFVPVITKKLTKNIEVKSTITGGDGAPLGTIVIYLGQTAPNDDWLVCDGRTIPSDSKYDALRTFLGKTTVPDFSGYVIKGADATDIAKANE